MTSINLSAVPAYPYPIDITQPDGTTLTIRLYGDENFHYNTTEDGYLIVRNQQDAFVYATVSQTGELQPTERIARNADMRNVSDKEFLSLLNVNSDIERLRNTVSVMRTQRMPAQQEEPLSPPQKATMYMGDQHIVVILVNFSDKSFLYPQSYFDKMTNQPGYSGNGSAATGSGSTGSVRDYFMSSSNGKFKPTFDVYGPYTLANNMAYYGQDSGGQGNDIRPAYMVQEACTLANADIDFSKYDYNNDGKIDNVVIIYAGVNQAEQGPANTIWPHRWSVVPGSNVPSGTNVTFDGKKLYDYLAVSELRGSSGSNMANVGTLVHEYSHIVGLPDYYNTSTGGSMVGTWTTMDQGNYNNNSRTPPAFSAYDRFYVGWFTPEQYISGSRTLYPLSQDTIPPANTTKQAYLLSATASNLSGGFNSTAPSPSEFFMVEYREKTGFDAYLPAAGMLIWHIDYSASVWANNTPNVSGSTSQTASKHMRVYLHPTNGLTNTTTGGAFTSGSFTPKLWAGTDINRPILNIVKNGTTNMFFGVGDPIAPTVVTEAAIAVAQTTATLSKTVTIGNEVITEQGFKYKKTSETDWKTSVTANVTVNLTGLTPNTKYQFYAYAITDAYPMTTGDTLSFTTACQTKYTNINVTIGNGDFVIFKGENISTTGSYNDTIVDVNGCDSIVILNLTVDNTTTSLTSENNTISLNITNQSGATYQWVDCDNDYAPIEGATSDSYTPTKSGNYAVIIDYGDGYIIVSECINMVISKITETEIDNVKIYPNPVKNTLFITNNENLTINSVEILDIAGKKIVNLKSKIVNSIDVSHLQQGVYFIKIELSNSTTVFEKFIKE